MAWERDGGDKDRKKFVHHFRETAKGSKGDKWTYAIKEQKEKVRAELVQLIRARREVAFSFFEEKLTPAGTHDQLVNVFEKLHSMPIFDYEERRHEYERYFGPRTAYRHLRDAFDTWCAIWFWPGDQLDHAPMPVDFLKPSAEALGIVEELRDKYHFFHWELEFPDVFTPAHRGFDAIIGNPPWEVQKPNSKEFFSNVDPLYRGYGKQEALDYQMKYFQHDPKVETDWLVYSARLKALSNWVKYVAHPFGDQVWKDKDGEPHHDFPLAKRFSASAADHATWKSMRQGRQEYADPRHPFQYQGSADLNTYKMFLEAGYSLLRDGGRLGLLVPSGIYSDKGTGELRKLFLNESRWSHLYAFQNERFVFVAVHHSFKVAAVQVEKGGQPSELRTRFRLGPGDSPEAYELETDIPDENGYLQVSVAEIEDFSPHSGAILEIRSPRDLEIVKRLYANGVLLGDQSPEGWNIRYTTEFHMTNDSKLFPPRWRWEEQGYRPDEYGNWTKGNWQAYRGQQSILSRPHGLILSADGTAGIQLEQIEDLALPLYQGVMIHKFDFAFKGLENPRGRNWTLLPWTSKRFVPQYLMSRGDYLENGAVNAGFRVGFRGVARTTDQHTLLSAAIPILPSADKVPLLLTKRPVEQLLLSGFLNSTVDDWVQRQRQSGATLNFFLMEDLPLLPESKTPAIRLANLLAQLNWCSPLFSREWLSLRSEIGSVMLRWALTPHERKRLQAMSDALVAYLFGLTSADFHHLLADCDHPITSVTDKKFSRTLDSKGFWRVEKGNWPELRPTVLAQIAFDDLSRMGLNEFLGQTQDEGWQVPETLRLEDYGLGQDDRAKEFQTVAAALGPRFYPWQLQQSVEESWEECERHAEILGKLLPRTIEDPESEVEDGAAPSVDLFGEQLPTDLFGNLIGAKTSRR